MPRGGRRHRKSNTDHLRSGTFRRDRHAHGDVPSLPAATPPSPPRGLDATEREVWLEVRREVMALGTFTAADLSAFKLCVRALTLAYAAGPDVKPTTRKALIESAARMLARFGCDPVSRQQADAAEQPREESKPDPLAEFRQRGARASGAR